MNSNSFDDFSLLHSLYNIAPETVDSFKNSQEFILNDFQLSYLSRKSEQVKDQNLARIVESKRGNRLVQKEHGLSVKQRVFDALTDGTKKYFVTLGFKYGADFLAYEGDPETCHAKYLVHVNQNRGRLLMNEMVLNERIANQAKKDLLVAYCKDDGELAFCGIGYDLEKKYLSVSYLMGGKSES